MTGRFVPYRRDRPAESCPPGGVGVRPGRSADGWALDGEAFPTTALSAGVRVIEGKSLAVQPPGKFQGGVAEVEEALEVADDLLAVVLEDLVAGLQLVVEIQLVAQTRAPPAGDAHPQEVVVRNTLGVAHLAQSFAGAVGYVQHGGLLVVLLAVVLDGALDGVLSQDRTVDLDRRQGQFFDDSHVVDGQGLVHGLTLEPLGGQAGGCDGRAAAEGLELRLGDGLGSGVHFDLEAHHVAALGGSDQAGTDVVAVLIQGADVAGVLEVVEKFFAVCHNYIF